MHRLSNWQLLAVCVLVWGTTWYAIKFQIGHAPPELDVALRFALAGAVVLAMCKARGIGLRFDARDHARFAAQGMLLYGVSYVCVYHAEQHLVSGLVAVGYSAACAPQARNPRRTRRASRTPRAARSRAARC